MYINYGKYTASWKKMFVTVINLGCIGIAGLIVCLPCVYLHTLFV